MFSCEFLPAGDSGLVVAFDKEIIDEKTNARVHFLADFFKKDTKPAGVLTVVPTYRSLLVRFDPLTIKRKELVHGIEAFIDEHEDEFDKAVLSQSANVVEIPVCYGGEFGPDLDTVAKYNNLSPEQVVNIHTQASYKVFMLGFLPGFPYLGGMDERIACPRLETPRTIVPAGSVGIASAQTGVYTVDSPGGWQLIGKTPLKLFAPEKEQPFLFQAGDTIVFKAIDNDEFEKLAVVLK